MKIGVKSLCIAALAFWPCAARAVVEVLNPMDGLNLSVVFPGDPSPGGSSPWLTAVLSDTGNGDEAAITLQTTGLPAGEFVSQVLINLSPALNPANLSFALGTHSSGLTLPSITKGASIVAGGGGDYNVLFNFPTSGSGRLVAGDQIQILIRDTTALYASSFLYPSTGGGAEGNYYAAAQLDNIPGSGANPWVGAPFYSPIPETPSIAFWLGAAVLGAAVALRPGFGRQVLAR